MNTAQTAGPDTSALWDALGRSIKAWGRELGFQAVGIADADLSAAEPGLLAWLGAGWHGEMAYLARHGLRRARPAELVPGTLRVIVCRMNYLAAPVGSSEPAGDQAAIARYARGRDYHKVLRWRLQKLVDRIRDARPESPGDPGFTARVFTDSAPVLEVELAARAGLGWRGKHTLALSRDAGSWFFLGEIYTNLPLPADSPVSAHCGSCERCIEACPTGAIRAPYRLDAQRCISYLTIELKGSIPPEWRAAIGNRVYGCDDCQLVCPWNDGAPLSAEEDFAVRNGLDAVALTDLFAWSGEQFLARFAGSPIRRIGYQRWLRNLAVGLGNAPTSPLVIAALSARADDPSALVREHVQWALERHRVSGGIQRSVASVSAPQAR